tara:strand:+ start:408 stop:623 length:216 start_codon:yes stop_codon:yes gene_type:complete
MSTSHRHVIDLDDSDNELLKSAMKRRGSHHGSKSYIIRQALRIFCELDAGNNDRAMNLLKKLRDPELLEKT